MHYLYKVKSKVPHQTATIGPVRFVDGASMWTDINQAKAAIGCGAAVRVHGGPCDPYLAVMEIDAPPGNRPTREDVSMAVTGKWSPPVYDRVIPPEYAPGFTPKKSPIKKSTKKKREYDFGKIGD